MFMVWKLVCDFIYCWIAQFDRRNSINRVLAHDSVPAGRKQREPEASRLIHVKRVNMFNYFAILEMPQKFDQLDLLSVQNLWIAISQLN